jgi:DNA-binding transcriptional ArsR family regulator
MVVLFETISGEQTQIDLAFHALSDPTRRDIVGLVLREEHSVSSLARRYPMSFAAVQKHVAVLERASLVTKHQRGRERMVRGQIDALRRVAQLFDQLETTWRDRLTRFGEVLAEPEPASELEPAPETEPAPEPAHNPKPPNAKRNTKPKEGAKR